MGITGISLAKLAILLLVILLIFGTKRLRSLGSELGKAVRSFRKAVDEQTQASSSESYDEPVHKLKNEK